MGQLDKNVSIQLGEDVPLINLQFSFSNWKAVPKWISNRSQETLEQRSERKVRSTGERIIEPTHHCSLIGFVGDLADEGYVLVDAFCQKRPNVNKSGDYWMVRFVFMRSELVTESSFERMRDPAMADLRAMCLDAMWRMRIFANPFYWDGDEVAGKQALSINLEGREPLRTTEGPLIMVWSRSRDGRNLKEELRELGVGKFPLRPSYKLCAENGLVSLVEA